MKRQRTIKQLERGMEAELTALGVGYEMYQECIHTECAGKIILGRHVCVYFSVRTMKRATQENIVRIFRKYWHRSCKRHSFEQTSYNNSKTIRSSMEITF